MGLKHTDFFESTSYEAGDTQIIVCCECLSHLCLSNLVLSDKFRGLSGEAYLVDKLINVQPEDKAQETSMITGVYLINKVRCLQCYTTLGWFYKKSFNYSESYKEGKYVIEKKYIREIPNNSSTATLVQQARLLRRRRSSANSFCSTSTDEDSSLESFRRRRDSEFKFGNIHVKQEMSPARLNFRDGFNLLSRLRFLGIDKDDLDEQDEDNNVFVDA